MFSEGVEWQVDVDGPKNGPVPGRPVNGYLVKHHRNHRADGWGNASHPCGGAGQRSRPAPSAQPVQRLNPELSASPT